MVGLGEGINRWENRLRGPPIHPRSADGVQQS